MDAGAGVGAAIGSGAGAGADFALDEADTVSATRVGADTESINVCIGLSMSALETSGKGRSCCTRLPEEKGKRL